MNQLIHDAELFVKTKLEGEASGHDWWHIQAVRRNAMLIAETETCDLLIVELAALFHDIADSKFNGGDHTVGPRIAREWSEAKGLSDEQITNICTIIQNQSYSANAGRLPTIEGRIVQDADRLEAIGAIGIARCFAYGGSKGRLIYDPTGETTEHSIQHFYDKLLNVKDLLNTKKGKELAEGRHKFLEYFLKQFHDEVGTT
jgi:uncharacterized protein